MFRCSLGLCLLHQSLGWVLKMETPGRFWADCCQDISGNFGQRPRQGSLADFWFADMCRTNYNSAANALHLFLRTTVWPSQLVTEISRMPGRFCGFKRTQTVLPVDLISIPWVPSQLTQTPCACRHLFFRQSVSTALLRRGSSVVSEFFFPFILQWVRFKQGEYDRKCTNIHSIYIIYM